MFDIKKSYNSKESILSYGSKRWLLAPEVKIFSEIHDKNLKVLDLWCWWWRTTRALYDMWFKNIIAVDIAENLIIEAKKNNDDIKDVFNVWDAISLDFKNSEFDIVLFSFNWLDYIQTRDERLKAYSEINRVLKKWWQFIFSSHNRFCLPVNRNLLKTIFLNIPNLFSEYWITKQSFWEIPTYYSSNKWLKEDLLRYWFVQSTIIPHNPLLFPFLDTFPYYVYKKS